MNVNFTSKHEQNITDHLSIGDSHVVLKELRNEINKGWNSPASKRSVKDIIKAKAIKRKAQTS